MTMPQEPGAHLAPHPAVELDGPLDQATAVAVLERADELLDIGELEDAYRHYRRVIGGADPAVTAAAFLGIGTIHWRADQEEAAIEAWRSVLSLPETAGTYLAYRQLASAAVKQGRIADAVDAYRQAERRAPAGDRAEIASRLGWLTKELGDTRASGRYFARSRSGEPVARATVVIVALTSIVSLAASLPAYGWLYDLLQLDRAAIADGELWRLLTCTLLHAPFFSFPFHLLFNMYALWFAGSIVERIYGRVTMVGLYLLTGIAASTASFVLGGDVPSVGASGAIFGMFGVLVAADRIHRPVVDRRSRAILGQLGALVAFNLFLGFVIPGIDMLAHLGGLVAGLWLGAAIRPGAVPTLSSFWRRPAGGGPGPLLRPGAVAILGIAALGAAIVLGIVLGTGAHLSLEVGPVPLVGFLASPFG